MANEANNQAQPAIMIRNQYIKDMSLEIPFAPAIFKEVNDNQPEIHVDMGMKSDVQEDGSYVVSLETKMDADVNGKKLFILELTYCANIMLNIPEEHKEPIFRKHLQSLC